MCGIVGYISRSGDRLRYMREALQAMHHRGPDNADIYESEDVAIGHTRLSIIDVDGGSQPIRDPESGVVIVVNGELYDFRRIMQECEADGYHPHTQTDSEIIIPLYLKYGLDMMRHLRGEFAFILYDPSKKLVIAARDRFGIKPLCWYQDNERIIIASEAKAILKCAVEPKLDRYSFMRAASMHYHPTERSLFEGIRQVEPGHMLIISEGKVKDACYWDIDYPSDYNSNRISSNPNIPSNISLTHKSNSGNSIKSSEEQDYVEQMRSLLIDSIRNRLIADVPVCCHLSGGLDSSSVAGIASAVSGKPVDCFSIIFDYSDEEYNEHDLAKETAQRCGSQLFTINVSQRDILDNLSDAVYFSEGLAVNGHLSCKFLLNKVIHANGYKVALTGEGADECLAGYSHLRQDAYALIPQQQREQLISQLYATNRGVLGVEIPYGDGLKLDAINRALGYVPSFLRAKAIIGYKVYDVLGKDFKAECLSHDFYEEMLHHYDIKGQLYGRHPINQSLYLWIKLTLVNYILGTLGDGCEMSASVEGRLPFLDHKLFEFARDLPMDMKLRGTVEKYILKEAARPYITDRIYRRQKHPFQSPPITAYLEKDQMQYLRDVFCSKSFAESGYFDSVKLDQLLSRISTMSIEEQTAYEPVIMLALTFYHLMDRYDLF